MEKRQSDLCLEILRRFHKAGLLDDLILIGSWCIYFYREYFTGIPYMDRIALKTRDLDFMIGKPSGMKHQVNIPDLLKDLGFVTVHKGMKGYIKLDHPDLILEFLVPEKGRGTDRPIPLPGLGMNAVALRFLDFLSMNTIRVKVEDFYLILPHPANFALHKLIIFQRRLNQEKSIKDRNTAVEVLKALIDTGEAGVIKRVLGSVPGKWQKKIISGIKKTGENRILSALGLIH